MTRFGSKAVAVGVALSTAAAVLIGATSASATTDSAAVGSAAGRTGCAANTAKIPAGANVAKIPDVDGDGKADTEYYSEGPGGFAYGIRTASGRTVRLADDQAGPGRHAGWTARFKSGPALTVLGDGRTATLHAFIGCRFVTTTDKHGIPWTFGLNGTSKYGSGVQCSSPRVSTRVLLGVLAKRQPNGRYRIASTTIRISSNGRVAQAGTTSTPKTTYRADSPDVQQAKVSTCWSTPIVTTSGR